jgi:hypothetical protein
MPLFRYNKIVGRITKIAARLKLLKPSDPFRIKMTDQVRLSLSLPFFMVGKCIVIGQAVQNGSYNFEIKLGKGRSSCSIGIL